MRKSLLCAVLLTTVTLSLVPLATLPPAAAVSTSKLGQPIAPNVYILSKTSTPDENFTTENVENNVWTSSPQFFVLGTSAYKVVTVGNDTWSRNDALYTYWVQLISDPDGSLNSSHPKMSGDEVRVLTTFVFENGTYAWTLNSRTRYWYRFNITSGDWNRMSYSELKLLNASIISMAMTTTNGQVRAYLRDMYSFMANVTAQPTRTSKYAYLSYGVDMAYLPKIERNPSGYDFSAFMSKDRFIAFVAYNDTNRNDIMDISVTRPTPKETASSLKSTEATYVFRPISAGAIAFIPVTSESKAGYGEAASWGFSVQNLLGAMVPTNQSMQAVNTTISSVEFDFHFMRNSTQAITKVDEKIGQFQEPKAPNTIPPQFNGLSLAIAYYSFFEGLSIIKYPAAPTDAVGNAVDAEGNSTRTNSLMFNSGGQNLVTIRIGGDTYTWKGEQPKNATSETVPWYSLQVSFTTVGNKSVVQVDFSRSKSVYAVCFPEWSGYSITHDPYFAVMTYSAQPSEAGTLPILIMGGLSIGVVLAAVTILVIRRMRTQGTAGMPQ